MATTDGRPSWYGNPSGRAFRLDSPAADAAAEAARRFHESIPGYAPTPLVDLPALARRWEVGQVLVKDESDRFGLPAFKALGASWAIARLVQATTGTATTPTYADTVAAARGLGWTLVTATDGNHGRAVAHFARRFGLRSVVVIPSVVSSAAEEAIAAEGADVRRIGSTYDEAVSAAAAFADAAADRRLVQDMAWPGYDEVPAWIAQGYRTMTTEITAQLSERGLAAPGLVAVPVGVGSLAESVVTAWRSASDGRPPSVLSCEPEAAACLLASLRAGRSVTVATGATIMAGLNCGTVSAAAWPLLRAGVDAAVAVTDDRARVAIRWLAEGGVQAGASGAASVAGVEAMLSGTGREDRRTALSVGPGTVVVLLNTESSQGAGGLASTER